MHKSVFVHNLRYDFFRCGDINAAYNIGRLFAHRCKMIGITSFNVDLNDPELDKSKRVIFFALDSF